jgi:ribosome-binding factor A
MPTRRQEKIARVVRQAVSDAIANHLSDPRIEGLVSVTRVDVSPDMRNAAVYLSVLAKDQTTSERTFIAIEHARPRLQSLLARHITGRYCPTLTIHRDIQLKKTLETMQVIEQVADELKQKDRLRETAAPDTDDTDTEHL